MANVGKASLLIVPKFDNLTGSVNRALGAAGATASASGSALGEKTGSGFGRGLGASGAVIGAFSTITAKAMDSISSHVGSAVSRFDTLNNYPKVMESLGYSSSAAESSIAKMSDRLSTLPTKLDSMVSLVQSLVTTTGDLDKATDVGLALNDMLVASGSSTEQASAAMEQFRQILSKGKPEMEDWRSLTTAMPGQMNQLAKSLLGPTANANDLYKAIGGGGEEATISLDQLMDKMVELDTQGGGSFASFKDQAETAAGGVRTSIDNMGNAVTKGIAATMDAIGKENISGVINDIKTGIQTGFAAFNSVIPPIVPVLKGLWGALKDVAPTVLTAGAAFATMSKGASAFGAIKSGLGVFPKLIDAFQLAAGGAGTLTEAFGAVGLAINPVTLGLGALAVAVGVGVTAFTTWKTKTDNLAKSTQGLSDAVARTTSLSDYRGRIDGVGQSAGFSAKSVDQLAESMAKSVDRMNENTEAAEATISQLNTAQQIVDDSIGKTDLSTEAQGRLEWALSTLNDQLGLNISSQDVLNGKYTDSNGEVQDLRQSIDDLVEAKKREAQMSAITANLTEAYGDQADAADALAKAQNDYNDQVDHLMDVHPSWTREQAEDLASRQEQGRALQSVQQQYDSATDAVDKYSAQLGDAAAATDGVNDAMQRWANGTGPLFESQLSSHGQSLTALTEDLRTLGASTDDLGKLSADQLEQLARDYDGTTTSIVSDLAEWGVGMDESAAKAAQAAGDIKSALDGMDGLADRLDGVGVNVSDLSQALADAGISTETLNEIGSDNLGALAEACNGDVSQMVAMLQMYNGTPLVNKDGSINVDDVKLVDAQGNLYTWNGSQLLDKAGNAVVDDVSVTDAQGHKVEWNGTNLLYKSADGTVHDLMSSSIQQRDEWNRTGLNNYSATGKIDIFANIRQTISRVFGNARGGIRPHADGGIFPRFHAQGGAIATRAVPLDIVGEAGAEAIVPLTNSKYSEPFARQIAQQMRDDQPSDAAIVVAWLEQHLPRIISTCTPVLGEREAARLGRRLVGASV